VGYPTAWLMQHKIRRAMAEGERGRRLSGLVEVDEGCVRGAAKGSRGGKPGRQAKSIVAVTVEHRPSGKPGRKSLPGRSAMAVVTDRGAPSLKAFVQGGSSRTARCGPMPGRVTWG
jgi:hypothetical protein